MEKCFIWIYLFNTFRYISYPQGTTIYDMLCRHKNKYYKKKLVYKCRFWKRLSKIVVGGKWVAKTAGKGPTFLQCQEMAGKLLLFCLWRRLCLSWCGGVEDWKIGSEGDLRYIVGWSVSNGKLVALVNGPVIIGAGIPVPDLGLSILLKDRDRYSPPRVGFELFSLL